MYLARQLIHNRLHYSLRESYRHGDIWLSRDLVALGTNPESLIHYRERNLFDLDEGVEKKLLEQGMVPDPHEVAYLLRRFLTPAAREVLERCERRAPLRPVSAQEQVRIDREIHIVDRRRLSFLRFGGIDQSRLFRMSPKLLRVLLDMSRDEREHYFWDREEEVLPAREMKEYGYAIFNLQAHFSYTFLRDLPHALPQEQLDEFFVQELCALQRDRAFWRGLEMTSSLHPYLVRYLLMYFDGTWRERDTWGEYVRRFMDEHRHYRPPVAQQVKMTEAARLFGLPWEELRALDRRSLARLYRQRAHELHPDKGGTSETFATLSEIYHNLMKHKG